MMNSIEVFVEMFTQLSLVVRSGSGSDCVAEFMSFVTRDNCGLRFPRA